MDNPQQQLAEKLKASNNILVTVSRNPSVDQLAACIGLTLLLNKLNKHAAAVFSGEVPSTLEFLQPEETLEKNTDSLRDFIIALDKSKADKLRYKVENNVVRIFITPYKTSITQDDLEFSQGDFNVDVVVALGVQNQTDIDEAITAHGRILHDATVATVNLGAQGDLGGINWNDATASSLSELVSELAQNVGKELIDSQIATALLTGIVAETNRFSNEKTSAQTMSVSAALMAAGANQQLVATKLNQSQEPAKITEELGPDNDSNTLSKKTGDPGLLEIDHKELPQPSEQPLDAILKEDDEPEPLAAPADSNPQPTEVEQPDLPLKDKKLSPGPKIITQPPSLGGTLSANTMPEGMDPSTDPLTIAGSNPPSSPLLSRPPHGNPFTEPPKLPAMPPADDPLSLPAMPGPADESQAVSLPPSPPMPDTAPPAPTSDGASQTLSDLEKSVDSPHIDTNTLNEARDEVDKAYTQSDSTPPTDSMQADSADTTSEPDLSFNPDKFGITSDPGGNPANPNAAPPPPDLAAAPPVPPPLPFQFGNQQ